MQLKVLYVYKISGTSNFQYERKFQIMFDKGNHMELNNILSNSDAIIGTEKIKEQECISKHNRIVFS